MKELLICFALLIDFSLCAQVTQNKTDKMKQIEESYLKNNSEIEKLQLRIGHLENDLRESKVNQKNDLEKSIKTSSENLKNDLERIDTRINYYLIFGGSLIAIGVFVLNWLGKKFIKKRVVSIIATTAEAYAEIKIDAILKEKLSNEMIADIIRKRGEQPILDLLMELETKGGDVLKKIKADGEEAISAMLLTRKNLSMWSRRPRRITQGRGTCKSLERLDVDPLAGSPGTEAFRIDTPQPVVASSSGSAI